MATTEKSIAACRIHSVFRNERLLIRKKRAPASAPNGNPINSRSKNSDGMMKKVSNRKMAMVNTTVANESRNSSVASFHAVEGGADRLWISVVMCVGEKGSVYAVGFRECERFLLLPGLMVNSSLADEGA